MDGEGDKGVAERGETSRGIERGGRQQWETEEGAGEDSEVKSRRGDAEKERGRRIGQRFKEVQRIDSGADLSLLLGVGKLFPECRVLYFQVVPNGFRRSDFLLQSIHFLQ